MFETAPRVEYKPEIGTQNSERTAATISSHTRDRKLEIRNQKSEIRNQKSEIRNQQLCKFADQQSKNGSFVINQQLILVIAFCPFDIIYRSNRFFFIRRIFRIICAPFYPVTMADFFLADQLTSQMQALRISVLYVCYYGLGEYSRRQNKCHSRGVYNTLYFIVAVIPFWFRFLQCVRRLYKDRDPIHGYNGVKYFSTIVAVLIRTAAELRKGTTWMVLALVSSAVATLMNTSWDIGADWGLLRRHSKNKYLRDRLLISHKSVYFIAMVINVVLRLVWMQQVLEFNLHTIHKMTITAIISCLEIIRRGIWSFFRLENASTVLSNPFHFPSVTQMKKQMRMQTRMTEDTMTIFNLLCTSVFNH